MNVKLYKIERSLFGEHPVIGKYIYETIDKWLSRVTGEDKKVFFRKVQNRRYLVGNTSSLPFDKDLGISDIDNILERQDFIIYNTFYASFVKGRMLQFSGLRRKETYIRKLYESETFKVASYLRILYPMGKLKNISDNVNVLRLTSYMSRVLGNRIYSFLDNVVSSLKSLYGLRGDAIKIKFDVNLSDFAYGKTHEDKFYELYVESFHNVSYMSGDDNNVVYRVLSKDIVNETNYISKFIDSDYLLINILVVYSLEMSAKTLIKLVGSPVSIEKKAMEMMLLRQFQSILNNNVKYIFVVK